MTRWAGPWLTYIGVGTWKAVDYVAILDRSRVERLFKRDSVADSVRMVMGENEDVSYKEKAKEMSAVFGDSELPHKYIDNFIQHLEQK